MTGLLHDGAITRPKPGQDHATDGHYRHVVKALDEMVWAITPPMLATIQEVVARRLAGDRLEPLELEERLADSHHGHTFAVQMVEFELRGAGGRSTKSGQIAVLPLYGVMMPRATLFSSMSGGTSVEQFTAAFNSMVNDPSVSAILLDIDSPGGSSDLIAELGQAIFDARGTKPIAAVANTSAGSAAYWVASQCDELGVTPSGSVGSIGVYGTHTDLSGAMEMKGIKPTTIQFGKYKTELSPNGPLSDEAHSYVQGVVDEMGAMFTQAVARGRGVTPTTVANDFGQGRMLTAKNAVKAGMADRVATFDQMLSRLARGAVASGKPGAQLRNEPTRITVDETDEPSPSAAALRDGTPDPLRELLEGAHATALETGNATGPLVVELDEQLTPAHLQHLHERLVPLSEEIGRKVVLLAKGQRLADVSPDDRDTTQTETPATAGEHERPPGSGLLHRRAVRAALRTGGNQ